MIVYLVICDAGDGSSYIQAFKEDDYEYMQKLLEEDESYWANEGSPNMVLNLPEGITPQSLGISLECCTN